MLKGAGKVISQATGGGVGANEIVIAMTVMFIIYSFVGGLVAAAWTDLFQGFLIIVLSFMLDPAGLGRRRRPRRHEGVARSVPVLAGDAVGHRSVGDRDAHGQWPDRHHGAAAQLATVGTGKDERTCRVGMLFGNMIKRVCTVGWALVGLIVAAMIAQGHADAAIARRSRKRVRLRVPATAVPGRAGPDDCVDSRREHVDLLGVSRRQRRAVHRGAYRQRLAPGRPDVHYLWVGRISGLVITLLGVVYAIFLIQSVLYTFLLTETMATFVGISVLGGIVWPRANRWGALASLVAALATNFALYSSPASGSTTGIRMCFLRRSSRAWARWSSSAC